MIFLVVPCFFFLAHGILGMVVELLELQATKWGFKKDEREEEEYCVKLKFGVLKLKLKLDIYFLSKLFKFLKIYPYNC